MILRLRRLMTAAFFFEAGLVLLVLPWSVFWDRNLVLQWSGPLYDFTRDAYVRGAVSGLGLVNVWTGIVEVVEAWHATADENGAGVLSPLDEARRGRA